MNNRGERTLEAFTVTETLSRFHHAADSADWKMLRDTLDEDVLWHWRGEDDSGTATDSARGATAVVEWLDAAMTGSTVRHHTMSHLVHVDGERADSTSYLLTVDTTTLSILASGVVRGQYRKAGDGWKISSIEIDERIPAGSVATLQARVSEK